jgi:hypothetical protein
MGVRQNQSREFSRGSRTILPLLGGEGRGEDEPVKEREEGAASQKMRCAQAKAGRFLLLLLGGGRYSFQAWLADYANTGFL